jgi:hypothetical protein
MLISLTLKRKPSRAFGPRSMEGRIGCFGTFGICNCRDRAIGTPAHIFVLKIWLSCLPPWSILATCHADFSDVSFRSISRNQASINHAIVRRSIMTETPIDKATERLLSGKFADFRFICEIPAHRMIVSEESRAFQSACTGRPRVSHISSLQIANQPILQGFSTSRVEIVDTDIEAMSRTLLFLYAGNYNDDSAPFLGKGTSSLPSNGNYSEAADDDSTLIGSPINRPRITTTSANPKPEKSSTETTTQQIKQLLANVNVYSCVRNLEIDGLVTLGRAKIISRAQKPFSAAALWRLLGLYSAKQNQMTWDLEHKFSPCVKYLTSVKANTDLVRLLMMHEHLAWTLLETKTRLMKPEENTKRSPNAQPDEVLKKSAECDRLAVTCEKLTAELLAAKDQCIDLSTRNGNLAAHNSELLDKTKTHGHKIGALYGSMVDPMQKSEKSRTQSIAQSSTCKTSLNAAIAGSDEALTWSSRMAIRRSS